MRHLTHTVGTRHVVHRGASGHHVPPDIHVRSGRVGPIGRLRERLVMYSRWGGLDSDQDRQESHKDHRLLRPGVCLHATHAPVHDPR
jgi:hypothetical protein